MEIERHAVGGRSHAEAVCRTAPKWWVSLVQQRRAAANLDRLNATGIDDEQCTEEQRTINRIETARYKKQIIEAAEIRGVPLTPELMDELVERRFG